MRTSPINELLADLRPLELASDSPLSFCSEAERLLRRHLPSIDDLRAHLDAEWDAASCLQPPSEDACLPIVIHLGGTADWCVRATVWPGSNEVGWRDVVHDHFGCIVTTALTPVAYDEARYEHIEQRTLSSIVPLRCGDIRVIVPATVHRIIPSREGRGVSLSVRTRALRVSASERQEPEGIARPRTRGQVDTRRTILATLGQL